RKNVQHAFGAQSVASVTTCSPSKKKKRFPSASWNTSKTCLLFAVATTLVSVTLVVLFFRRATRNEESSAVTTSQNRPTEVPPSVEDVTAPYVSKSLTRPTANWVSAVSVCDETRKTAEKYRIDCQ